MSRVREDDPLFSNVKKRSSLTTFSSHVLLKKMLVVLQHPVPCNIAIVFEPNKESLTISGEHNDTSSVSVTQQSS